HLRKFLLCELKPCKRAPELHPLFRVFQRYVKARHRSPDRTPRYSVPSLCQTTERALQSFRAWQDVLFRNQTVFKEQLRRVGRAKAELVMRLFGAEPLRSSLNYEPAYLVRVIGLGPNNCDMCHRAVG